MKRNKLFNIMFISNLKKKRMYIYIFKNYARIIWEWLMQQTQEYKSKGRFRIQWCYMRRLHIMRTLDPTYWSTQ